MESEQYLRSAYQFRHSNNLKLVFDFRAILFQQLVGLFVRMPDPYGRAQMSRHTQ